ncbi:class II D-tagatose-bisphosphate aldolase non-catalytic subunit [candidate division KSB1 bacterium]
MGELRRIANSRGVPLADLIVRTIQDAGLKSTTLSVCPNSEAVVEAALRTAEAEGTPMMFAATLNQVDLDGGYTGWTPGMFVEKVRTMEREFNVSVDVAICSDHSGPWCKDIQAMEKWPLLPAMWGIKASVVACMEAGYDLLHIDPTIDKTLPPGEHLAIETVIERTLELIDTVERFRRSQNLPRMGYEVGTEEVHGGLADKGVFKKFLTGLVEGLAELGYEDVWPVFVVGKVGTDLHTTEFDPSVARELVGDVVEFGSFIKGHYTDYCSNLQDYPASGMGGANVGPEFTEAEYDALEALVAAEIKLARAGIVQASGFMDELTAAVVASGRWEKWRQPEEAGLPFEQFDPERKKWLTKTGCRYVWTAPKVVETRKKLYANLENNGIPAGDEVVAAISEVIRKYISAFNLGGLQQQLEEHLNK